MTGAEVGSLAAGLLALTAATVGLARWGGLGLGWAPVVALSRAAVQLTVVALLLRGVLTAPGTVAAFVVLMLLTASWTALSRLRGQWHGRRAAVAGVVVGSGVSLAALLAVGLVDLGARSLVAVGGIVIGSTMSASTLAGRSFGRAVRARSGEVEGWLALGATPAQAHRALGRESAREALLPNLDQTRATGLVTLPGAFVGALFAGAPPAEAAQFQLVVLAGIALAGTVTVLVVTRWLGRSPFLPVAD